MFKSKTTLNLFTFSIPMQVKLFLFSFVYFCYWHFDGMTRSLAGFSRFWNRKSSDFFPGCSFPKLKFLSNSYCMRIHASHLVWAFVSYTSSSGLSALPGVGPRNRHCRILEWRTLWASGTKLAKPFAMNSHNSTGWNNDRRHERFLDFASYLYLVTWFDLYNATIGLGYATIFPIRMFHGNRHHISWISDVVLIASFAVC